MCVCVCALVHPIRFDPQYRVRYWVFSEPLRQEGGRPQGGWGGWVRTSIQLPSPSGVRYLSLSLSLSLLLLLLSRESCTKPLRILSLSVSLSVSVSLSLSLCVCLTFHVLVHLGPVPLLTQTLHSSRVRLNASRVSSVCFGLFCVVCFRSMSLPRFGNLWIFPSYHLGRRTGLIKASRGGRLHRRRRSRTW